MSVLVVQVGQCGNQLGESLFSSLAPPKSSTKGKPAAPPPASPYFHLGDGKARCVLVDSEPKVVEGILQRNKGLFRAENAVVGSSGRGNNWGAGYHGLARREKEQQSSLDSPDKQKFRVNEKDQREQDDSLLLRAVRAVHKETCRVEDGALEAILVIHSLAGGTGSGFGCRLAQALREHFILSPEDLEAREDEQEEEVKQEDYFGGSSPQGGWSLGRTDSPKARATSSSRKTAKHYDNRSKTSTSVDMEEALSGEYGTGCKAMYLVSIAVAPSTAGETAVQGYNLALTLDALKPVVDSIILLRNDFTKFKGFQDANEFFSSKLLLPVLKESGSIGDLISHCCPDPPGAPGTNKVLTLLPLGLPQYAAFHGSVLRCRTYYTKASAHVLDTSKLMFNFSLKGEQQRRGIAARGQFSNYDSHQLRQQQATEYGLDEADFELPMSIRATDTTVKLWPSRIGAAAAGGNTAAGNDGVVVLNQTKELQRYLFPFLKDCALKLQAGAFLHQYEKAGVSREYLEGAITNVVRGILETE